MTQSNKEAEEEWINEVTMQCLYVFEMTADIFIEQSRPEKQPYVNKSSLPVFNNLLYTVQSAVNSDTNTCSASAFDSVQSAVNSREFKQQNVERQRER